MVTNISRSGDVTIGGVWRRRDDRRDVAPAGCGVTRTSGVWRDVGPLGWAPDRTTGCGQPFQAPTRPCTGPVHCIPPTLSNVPR